MVILIVALVLLEFAVAYRAKTRTKPVASSTETEFTAEVVRIASLHPHPNADRLELARIELKGSGIAGYDVVVQKGTYQPGDLAAYISVDCIVPTAHPEFAFLKERVDGKDKEKYRIKAARLRGVFSQGLLVRAPGAFPFGESVAAVMGIEYHRADEPGEPTASGKSKKRKPQPWPIYGVESLKKVPRLFENGEPVYVTEKIHGTNFRFGWVRKSFLGIPLGWKFRVGSHRVMKGDGSPGFYGKDIWAQVAADNDLAKLTEGWKGYLFVGEIFGEGVQDLTYSQRTPAFKIFDVNRRGEWLDRVERELVCSVIRLPTVPLLYNGPFHAGCLDLAEGKSVLDGKTLREGVVIESDRRDRKAKFVSQGYLLRKSA